MLKWFSGEEGEPGPGGPGPPSGPPGDGQVAVEEMEERLIQTEQLVNQLKDMIREKEAALRSRDEQIKVEKEAAEARMSKLRLQNKAKVTSLTTQLETLRRQTGETSSPKHGKKGSVEGGSEQANRGKIVLLKKKVEELEHQLSQKDGELETERDELASQRRRGEDMDALLAEKEAVIIQLQQGLAGAGPAPAAQPPPPQEDVVQQQLLQSLNRKVEEAEERYSLLQEQASGLQGALAAATQQYEQKEAMYEQNIQTFKDILLQKDAQLAEVRQTHETELFKLAAKSDASADLEQLLKALKQKLHEKEEVLLGKTQVIDVLQGEVDGRDQQIKDLAERLRRLQVERESLASRMEAEKHVMRAQLRDLMEKQQMEVQRLQQQHEARVELLRTELQQEMQQELEQLRVAAPSLPASADAPATDHPDPASSQRIAQLEAEAKQKTEEAGRSEAKFLKMKAWSKSRIRQLEDELKKSQAGAAPPDLTALRSHITALEEEREENRWRLDQYEDLRAQNDMLEAKLVLYEEQQRSLQMDLEQFTKRAASQASESGSADEVQNQVLEWQEMVAEAVSARDRAREEKAASVLRITHLEEEREALASRQQELEEELAQTRGLGHNRAKKLAPPSQRSLQEDFEFDGQSPFQEPHSASESTTPMEGENMGGWWPEYTSPDTDGLRSVVEQLELERNQLQEQILVLEERCQDLEDRLQLQARIETLQVTFDVDEDEQPCGVSQADSEKLQSQLASVRSQQSRDAEKHQLLVGSLTEQLRGLTDTQECLESSLVEKETTLAATAQQLELVAGLRHALGQKEAENRELAERLLHAEHDLENVTRKCSGSEKQSSDLKVEVNDLTQKLSALKEKAQKQEVALATLQAELDQTNEELDKLNQTHLDERAGLIHDLQSCEREMDGLRDALAEKDKELAGLAGSAAEYAEQLSALKREAKLKEESLVQLEDTLTKAERDLKVLRDSQSSDQQGLNGRITELLGKLQDATAELTETREDGCAKAAELQRLAKQAEEDERTVRELRRDLQEQAADHRSLAAALKEQLAAAAQKLQQAEGLGAASGEKLRQELRDKEQEIKSVKEQHNQLLAQVEALTRQLEQRAQSEAALKEQLAAAAQKLEQAEGLGQELHDKEKEIKSVKEQHNQLLAQVEVLTRSEAELRDTMHQKAGTVTSLEEQLVAEAQKLQQAEGLGAANSEALRRQLCDKEQEIKSVKEQHNQLLAQVEALTLQLEQRVQSEAALKEQLAAAAQKLQQAEGLGAASGKKLRREIRDKEQEIKSVKEQHNQLLAQVEALNLQLEQRAQSEAVLKEQLAAAAQKLDQVVNQKDSAVTSLEEQLAAAAQKLQQAEGLSAASSEALQGQLRDKEQEIKSVKEQHNQLLAQVETLTRQLEQRAQSEAALKEQLAAAAQKLQQAEGLGRELCDKEQEIKSVKEQHNQLLAQVQALEQSEAALRDAVNEKAGAVTSLEEQLAAAAQKLQQVEGLGAASGKKLRRELRDKEQEIKSVKEQHNQLLAQVEALNQQLEQRAQSEAALKEQLAAAAQKLEQAEGLGQELRDKEQEIKSVKEQHNQLLAQVQALTRSEAELRDVVNQKDSAVTSLEEQLAAAAQKLQQAEGLSAASSEALQGQLRDKEQEIKSVKEQHNQLLAQVEALNLQLEQRAQSEAALKAQLEATAQKLQQAEGLGRELRDKEQEIKSVKEQHNQLLAQVEVLTRSEAALRDAMNQKAGAVTSLEEQLEAARKHLEEQLRVWDSQHEELSSNLKSSQAEKQQLQEKLRGLEDKAARTLAEAAAAAEALRAELSAAETLHSENATTIKELRRERDELTERTGELSRVLEQNSLSNSKLLLAKTEECGGLERLLAEGRAELDQLQRAAGGVHAETEARRDQQRRLEETVSHLREQESKLRAAALEKEAELHRLRGEAAAHVGTISELRDEAQALTQERRVHKEELDQRNQTIRSLTDRVGILEEAARRLEAESEARGAELAALNSRIQAAAEENRRLGEEAARLAADNSELTSEGSRLRQGAAALQETINGLLKDKEELLATAGELRRSAAAALLGKTDECSKLSEMLEEKERAAAELTRRFESRHDELEKRNASVMSLSAQLGVMNQSAAEMEAEIGRLTASAQEAEARREAEVQALSSARTQQENLVQQLGTRLQRSVQDNADLQERVSELQAREQQSLQQQTELQNRVHFLSAEAETLGGAADRNQSALDHLRDQNAARLEELQDLRAQLSEAEALSRRLLQEKEEALAAQRAGAAALTVELDRVRAQHLQVAAQLDALTENLEQREMALHAINGQYAALAARAAQLTAERRSLEEQNRNLEEQNRSLEEQNRSLAEQNRSLDVKEAALKPEAELTRSLQAQVSARDQQLSHLQDSVQNLESVLRDSEDEWISVLDRERRDKEELAGRLSRVEAELAARDAAVAALEERLVEAREAREAKDQLESPVLEEEEARRVQNQQQEQLLAALSQQLKDRDGAVNRVMEAASGERVRLGQQNRDLTDQNRALTEQLERSEQLKLELQKDEEVLQNRVTGLSREKEAGRRKLQAALLARKELIRRVEELQNQNQNQAEQEARLREELQNQDQNQDQEARDSSPKGPEPDLEAELAHAAAEKLVLQKKLTAALLARRETARKLEAKEAELKELRDSASSSLEAKEAELSRRQDKKAAQKAEFQRLEAELHQQQDKNATQEAELQAKEAELETVSAEAGCKNEALAEMELHSAALTSQLGDAQAEARHKGEELEKHQAAAQLAREAELARVAAEKLVLQKKLQAALLARRETARKLEAKEAELKELHDSVSSRLEVKEAELEAKEAELKELRDSASSYLKSKEAELQAVSAEAGRKDEVLAEMERHSATLTSQLGVALAEARHKGEELEKHQREAELVKEAELKELRNSASSRLEAKEAELQAVSVEMGRKDEALAEMERLSAALTSQLGVAQAEARQKGEELEKHQRRAELAKEAEPREVQDQQQDELQLLQKSPDDTRTRDQQDRTGPLARKLQAALLSRKELLKENASLKQEVEASSARQTALLEERDRAGAEARRLHGENGSLAAACNSLKLTIEGITQQKRAFSHQLASLQDSQHAALQQQEEPEQAEARRAEMEVLEGRVREAERHRGRMLKLAEENQRLEAELSRLQNKNATQEAELQRLEAELHQLQDQNAHMEAELPRLLDQNTTQEAELSRQEAELSRLQDKNATQEAELSQQEAELRKLQDKNTTQEAELQRLEAEPPRLQEQKRQLEAELHQLQDRSALMEAELQRLEAEHRRLQDQNQGLEAELSRLQDKNATQEAELSRLQDQKQRLEDMNAVQEAELRRLQDSLADLQDQNRSLLARVEAQDTELRAQREEMEEIRTEQELESGRRDAVVRELQDVIERRGQDAVGLGETVRILQDDKAVLQEELEGSREAVSALQAHEARLEARILELETQLRAAARRGSEGSRSARAELQELLREKQQEVRLLQQDCLRYQDRVLDLEAELKKLQEAGLTKLQEAELKLQEAGLTKLQEAELKLQEAGLTKLQEAELKLQEAGLTKLQEAELKLQEAGLKKLEEAGLKKLSAASEAEQLDPETRAEQTEPQVLEQENPVLTRVGSRDGSPDRDAGGGAGGPKHEIRQLLHQMDDLNSENALLRAQLVRYRQDLNRVLALKDHQLQDLLAQQLDRTRDLEREAESLRAERDAAAQKVLDLEKQNRATGAEHESLRGATAALQDDRDRLIQDFKVLQARYDRELRESRNGATAAERRLQDAGADLAALTQERDVLARRLAVLDRPDRVDAQADARAGLHRLLDELTAALAGKERELALAAAQSGAHQRQLAAFSGSMAALQDDRDRLMDLLAGAGSGGVAGPRLGAEPGGVGGADPALTKLAAAVPRPTMHQDVQREAALLRSGPGKEDLQTPTVPSEAERIQLDLQQNLQRCVYEIQQRDQNLQQLSTKLQQAGEEKAAVAAQLRAVSQTLRDTQDRVHWLENQNRVQGPDPQVAPGAPQERSTESMMSEAAEAPRLRDRLLEAELSLAEEKNRREAAEEALRLAEENRLTSSGPSRDVQRDISIDMEAEDEWDAVSLDPTQPLVAQKVKGGVVSCRRWLRGRSLYFSRLLTSRGRSRYLFLAYLLTLHLLLLLCLTGAL
ncbi:centrosome-associated protein CEP250-like isoform X2 [Cololabis saira]|uniref:centrosome-associated protein CEP250-like isoform X2 n=1 Tax=Cololabis saira TaxID=129043 RepID=UPI002AD55075|nr:centrosome-associated protein CEP250-like isoform X2 [Cololabis saira]